MQSQQLCFATGNAQQVCVSVTPLQNTTIIPPPVTPNDAALVNVWNGAVAAVARRLNVSPARAAVFLTPFWDINGFSGIDVPLSTTFNFGQFVGDAFQGATEGFRTGIAVGQFILQAGGYI